MGPPLPGHGSLLPYTLGRMQDVLQHSSDPNATVIWAIACTAFFWFFRLGELLPDTVRSFNPNTSLSWGDVVIDNQSSPQMAEEDQFGSGLDSRGNGGLLGGKRPLVRSILLGYIREDGHQDLVCHPDTGDPQ